MDVQTSDSGTTPLRSSLEKLITKSAAPILISCVNSGTIQFANSSAINMYGYSRDAFIGNDISSLLYQDENEIDLQKAFLTEQGAYHTDAIIQEDNEGDTFAAEFLALPMRYEDEKSVLIEINRVKKGPVRLHI